MDSHNEHANKLALIPLKLRGTIGTVLERQRIFFESHGTFDLTKADIEVISEATELFPEFQMNQETAYLYSDHLVSYYMIKTYSVPKLLEAFFGLLRPVYNRMVESGELDGTDVGYLDFVLYLINQPTR